MTAVPTDARFTAGQRAALERIEAAVAAPESFDTVEAVVNALYSVTWPTGEPKLHMARVHARDLAVAVLAALDPQ